MPLELNQCDPIRSDFHHMRIATIAMQGRAQRIQGAFCGLTQHAALRRVEGDPEWSGGVRHRRCDYTHSVPGRVEFRSCPYGTAIVTHA